MSRAARCRAGRHADRDKLKDDITCPAEGHLIALVIWPNVDFHFYRMNRDGLWSHKPGGMPVTNVDNSDKLIPTRVGPIADRT